MKKHFIRRVKFLQSTTLICVILMLAALIRISAIIPGLNPEADQTKESAKNASYRKEYIRGSILDRNGNVLAESEEPDGERTYTSTYAFSALIGYDSSMYGQYGIENTLNTILTHSDSNSDNKKGSDVTLTLDANLQEKAYELIREIDGSVVILDVKTGEILALASSKTYDANALEENWKEINETEGVLLPSAYKNAATPGSVFKIVTSKEIIEEGIDEETIEDTGSYTVNGQTIRNYHGEANGTISYMEGFVHSSNVYFMNRAVKLGAATMENTAKAFLLGEKIPLDFTTIESKFDLGDYSDNMLASTAFGQGNTEVTALHMAMITQSVANDGVMLKPYLFQYAVNGKGEEDSRLEKGETEVLQETMESEIAWKIQEAMTKAGEHYELKRVGDGYKIAAKTGTAERGDGTNNAWITTYAPADDPRYVITVNQFKTEKVGKSLAPVAENLYEQLF